MNLATLSFVDITGLKTVVSIRCLCGCQACLNLMITEDIHDQRSVHDQVNMDLVIIFTYLRDRLNFTGAAEDFACAACIHWNWNKPVQLDGKLA